MLIRTILFGSKAVPISTSTSSSPKFSGGTCKLMGGWGSSYQPAFTQMLEARNYERHF